MRRSGLRLLPCLVVQAGVPPPASHPLLRRRYRVGLPSSGLPLTLTHDESSGDYTSYTFRVLFTPLDPAGRPAPQTFYRYIRGRVVVTPPQ